MATAFHCRQHDAIIAAAKTVAATPAIIIPAIIPGGQVDEDVPEFEFPPHPEHAVPLLDAVVVDVTVRLADIVSGRAEGDGDRDGVALPGLDPTSITQGSVLVGWYTRPLDDVKYAAPPPPNPNAIETFGHPRGRVFVLLSAHQKTPTRAYESTPNRKQGGTHVL